MFLVPSCSCLYPINWSQGLSREWRCTWVINNIISIVCHTLSPAPVLVRTRIPEPWQEAMPSARMVGSQDPCEYWGRWHNFDNTYLICIIAQVLKNYFDTPHRHSVSGGNGEWQLKAETRDQEFCTQPTTTATTNTSVFNDRNRHIWDKTEFNKFYWGCHHHSPINYTC